MKSLPEKKFHLNYIKSLFPSKCLYYGLILKYNYQSTEDMRVQENYYIYIWNSLEAHLQFWSLSVIFPHEYGNYKNTKHLILSHHNPQPLCGAISTPWIKLWADGLVSSPSPPSLLFSFLFLFFYTYYPYVDYSDHNFRSPSVTITHKR